MRRMSIKKAKSLFSTWLSFCLTQTPITIGAQLELNYFLCFFIKNLNIKDIEKLTIAPMVANTIVFRTSSEFKFGKTLKNVPPAVPTKVGLLFDIFFGC